jgi:hypothetical protein
MESTQKGVFAPRILVRERRRFKRGVGSGCSGWFRRGSDEPVPGGDAHVVLLQGPSCKCHAAGTDDVARRVGALSVFAAALFEDLGGEAALRPIIDTSSIASSTT